MSSLMTSRSFKTLLCTSALSLGLMVLPAQAELGDTEHVPALTFAGAYLAGDVARQDSNFGIAARYYAQALELDPDNELIERELMVALLTDGQFDEAKSVAQELTQAPQAQRLAKLALGIDAIRKGDFEHAREQLIIENASDLERLMGGILIGWADHGLGNTEQALAGINALQGPDWYGLFQIYHAALISLDAGQTERAAELFDTALANRAAGAASPRTYLRMVEARTRMALAAGDLEAAVAALNQGFAMAPTQPSLSALRDTIDTPAAADPLIVTVQDGAAEILHNLGSAINRDGSETFAALYLEMGRALAPDNDVITFELGGVAESLGNPAKAIEYYEQVPDTSPLRRLAALHQGLSLADLERTDEAVTTLEELVAANPTDHRGYLALGGVYSSNENFEESARVYEEAMKHIDTEEPSFWPLHYRLAIAYERTKQWEKAEPVFLKALELSPDQPDVLNYLGYSWIDMNINLEEGLEMIRKAVELRPTSGHIVDSLGWAYYRLGEFDNAVEQLEHAADLLPREAIIIDHLGDAYWRVGRKLEATHQWSTALDFDLEDELKESIEAKLQAANTAGVEPEIATAIVDDAEEGASTDSAEATGNDG